MNYIFLGGAGEVGASCMLLSVEDRRILIDCGIRVNERGNESLPDLDLFKECAPKLDAIFITHAHSDHVGALPVVHKMYPNTPIYMTSATQTLSGVMLKSAVRIMEETRNVIYTIEDVIPLSESDSSNKKTIQRLPVGQWIPFWEGWRFMFIHAGHILGAVSILMETPDGTFFYTGDVSLFNQKTIDGLADVYGINPDFMWCEGTYGDSNHPSRATEEKKLALAVAQVVENGGTVLIPSFALGRAQEILLILQHAMESKVISSFPVYVDGLVQTICSLYHYHWKSLGAKLQNKLKNMPPRHREIFRTQHVGYVSRQMQKDLTEDGTPKCIIASSGMLIGGASVVYAKALAGNTKNAIFLSGYQDAESPGRRLQELKSGDNLTFSDGVTVEVKCDVQRFHLSAHSDQGQLISMIKQVNPKALAFVHGDPAALHILQQKLDKHYPVSCPVNSDINIPNIPQYRSEVKTQRVTYKEDVDVKVSEGVIQIDTRTVQSQQWQNIEKDKLTAVIEGDKLTIHKK